jgi:tetratricopeptide (TPR) repeat protein
MDMQDAVRRAKASEKLTKEQLLAAGDSAFDDEDFEKALDFYHRATVLDGQDPVAWTAMAMTYFNMEFPQEAWRSYKLALRADPDNTSTMWYASEFLFNMEDYELARALLERYVEREVDPERLLEAKDMLAECQREIAVRGGGAKTKSAAKLVSDEEDDDWDEDDEIPEGFDVDKDEDEDLEDEDELDDEYDEDAFDDDDETFVATLVLQLSGHDAQCSNCATRIPADAPYCYNCLAPHFYEEN